MDDLLEHDDLLETPAADAETHDDDSDHGGHEPTSMGVSNLKLAMWIFLGSECLLFGALISTYLLSKANFITELTAGNPNVLESLETLREVEPEKYEKVISEASVEPIFDIPFTSASSFILLMSSLSMVLAHSAISKRDYKGTRVWLAATALLGSTFIAGQVVEFTVFFREGIFFNGNLFGSAFYTLTGFHGVHVTIGILMLVTLLILSFSGKLKSDRAETVELVGLYWHFVDIVWVLIFTIVYLIP